MVKIIGVFGAHTTGKTCLIQKYVKKRFTESYISTMTSDVSNDSHKNIIWDTPGNLRWIEDAIDVSIKCHGIILCFSPSSPESFHESINILKTIKNVPCVIAATMCDRLPFSIRSEWSSEAKSRNSKIIRTSAATGEGVSEIFEEIFSLVKDEKEVNLGSVEYASNQLSTCIYYGINDYIYELD